MSEQLWEDEPRARKTDRATSHEAAKSVKNVTEVQRGILLILSEGPRCDFDLQVIYNGRRHDLPDGLENYPRASDSGLRTRRHELERKGYIIETDDIATLPSGRKAMIFAITEEGRKQL